eukprot:scaffold33340_cov26-Tisochrysis_lutea.AAC.1
MLGISYGVHSSSKPADGWRAAWWGMAEPLVQSDSALTSAERESSGRTSSQQPSSHGTPSSSQGASPEPERPAQGSLALLLVLSSSSDVTLEAEMALLRRLREMVSTAVARETSRDYAARALSRLVVRTAHWEPAWSAVRDAVAACKPNGRDDHADMSSNAVMKEGDSASIAAE